ncbi:MAG: thioredoxin domain-containing protein [Dehalococcoidia bacterium]|nr:thioredoxin domain-containing protein [Dehalococcoidia bacterium]
MNNLVGQKSEYLLQHSNNPVNWYPWGKKAFDKAKGEDKPIFLSIGYSSCHWCHVMEKESFEDLETAEILNKNFISIKVDREERPDIDSVYMAAIQMINGNGGWPASIFMNYKGAPFFAGTYFPKFDHNNIPAFKSVLAKIIDIYHNNRSSIDEHSNVVMEGLRKYFNSIQTSEIQINNIDETITSQINKTFDFEKGGFGDFPKFPETSKLEILYMIGKKNNSKNLYDMGQLTLGSMINGGIYDQLKGGFARYSTDREWKIPHFEKMLYDNALILGTLANSYKVTNNKKIMSIIKDTFMFLEQEMQSNNLYFSSIDADSEGIEGEYYLWEFNELKNILTKSNFEIVKDHWNITEEGDIDKKNILYINKSLEEIAVDKNLPIQEIEDTVNNIKNELISKRNSRVKPLTDKKIISSWNSLLISSLCEAYNITNEEKYIKQAQNSAESILKSCFKNNNLNHTSEGEICFLEDYSYFSKCLFDIYNSTLNTYWYELAEKFTNSTIDKFWDENEKVFFDTFKNDDLILRPKGFFDPMVPNPAAIAAQNTYKLYKYNGNNKLLTIVGDSLKKVSSLLNKNPLDVPSWYKLYYQMEEEQIEILISGHKRDKLFLEAKKNILSRYLPNLLFTSSNGKDSEMNLPIMKGRKNDQKTKIYICKNYVCDIPLENINELVEQLDIISGSYK